MGVVDRWRAGYACRLPVNASGRRRGGRPPEWNFAECEAYRWGASRAGGDERKASWWLVALDEVFRIEYDSRLSRKRDSEQVFRCLTIESGIRMCEANSK
jgi:hypothetical protein